MKTNTYRVHRKLLCGLMVILVILFSVPVVSASAAANTTILDLADGPVYINSPGDYMIVGSYMGGGTAISVGTNGDCNITLAYVYVESPQAMEVWSDDVTINLIGNNTLISTGQYSAGISAARVEINGFGSLTVSGEMDGINGGDIIINGGTIDATGQSGYGIGSDWGSVTINGGNITATGDDVAIGDLYDLYGYVGIFDATVKANGRIVANGYYDYGGELIISNSTVIATGVIESYWKLHIINGSHVTTSGLRTYSGLYVSADSTVVFW